MPGLVPGIHVLGLGTKDVDGRDKPGHDEKQQDCLNVMRPAGSGGLRRLAFRAI
jgi:hypothetical protein